MNSTYFKEVFRSVLLRLIWEKDNSNGSSIHFVFTRNEEKKVIEHLEELDAVKVTARINASNIYPLGGVQLTITQEALEILSTTWLPTNEPQVRKEHGEQYVELIPKSKTSSSLKLFIGNRQAIITNNDIIIYKFSRIKTNRFRYFKCLWLNCGMFVDYQTIYEFDITEQYPGRKKRFQTNSDIRRAINKLKQELVELPVKITINSGCSLTFN